ncbi:tripartite tricarboxylate transporter substrate-binding protein [Pseudorhodoferax sp. LjRoot39]|uniref:Bug family tripartite tricarboxylate transporter substrate binding protein n=1 Tax=Pseudorhodoferax sp. LjRoot39 TaxID=3342328 RepID=UPI003ECDF403
MSLCMLIACSWAASMAGLAAPIAPVATAAPTYPHKLITFVTPFTAGAAPDVLVRALAAEVAAEAGVKAIVENKPGASAMLAAQSVARAAPDGYTVLVTGNVAFTGNPHVFKKLPYDPVADFTPVNTVAKGPMILYVNQRKMPVDNIASFVDLVRKNPGKFSFAYTSITSRLPAEVLRKSAGLDIVGVPYRSGNAALPDLVSGEVDMLFTDLSGMPFVQSGKLRPIGVTDAARSPFAPELATFEEAGVQRMDIGFWLGVFLPAKAPPEVVNRLNALLARAAATPAAKAANDRLGTVPTVLPAGQFGRFVVQESQLWGQIVRDAGIQAE